MTTDNPTSPREELARDVEWLRAQKDILHPLDVGQWSPKNERIDRIIETLSRPPVKAASPEGGNSFANEVRAILRATYPARHSQHDMATDCIVNLSAQRQPELANVIRDASASLGQWKDNHHDCDCPLGETCGCNELREIITGLDCAVMDLPTPPASERAEMGLSKKERSNDRAKPFRMEID